MSLPVFQSFLTRLTVTSTVVEGASSPSVAPPVYVYQLCQCVVIWSIINFKKMNYLGRVALNMTNKASATSSWSSTKLSPLCSGSKRLSCFCTVSNATGLESPLTWKRPKVKMAGHSCWDYLALKSVSHYCTSIKLFSYWKKLGRSRWRGNKPLSTPRTGWNGKRVLDCP